MALYKIEDFNPNYRQEAFDGDDVKGLEVYAGGSDEKIGTIHDVLVDETGRFRYLVIDTGFWIFGKKVLLPMGRCRVDVKAQRVYATGIVNKHQAEKLPEYHDSLTVDYDYEERVRGVYRTPTVENSAPIETSQRPVPSPASHSPASHSTYSYDREPALYNMNEQDHQTLRLYEERLVTNKTRRQAGEVTIGKHIETQTVTASVPVQKERVVIERQTPQYSGTLVSPGEADFSEGQVARIDIYEETADIHKQPFVREEVNIRKEVDRDTVEATETLRREELDIDTQGRPNVQRA